MKTSLWRFSIRITFCFCFHLKLGSVRSVCLKDQQSSLLEGLCLKDQQLSLLKLKQTLIFNSTHSSKLASWDSSTNCCSWAGVTCSDEGHVIGLDLSNESILGGIDNSSSLFDLHYLQALRLAGNKFNGARIPPGLGKLANLRKLELSVSEFSGQIPSFSMLKNLTYLDLSYNNLSGQISSIHWENLSNLVHLYLQGNLLEGSIPLSLFSIPSLQTISLSNNSFSGQISDFPVVSSSQLVFLDLRSNRLEGSIPNSIFRLQSLMKLLLSSNSFNGTLELSNIQNLRNLCVLDLSFNDLMVDDGSDNINLTSFPQLSTLLLASCKLTKFPSFLRNQSRIWDVDLSDNQIHGEIPNWISNLPLAFLNLSYNLLTKVERSFDNLSSLCLLDLHSNQLQGDIPNVIKAAEYMDYSENQFSVIPANIGNSLNYTSFFSVSDNYIRGVIPESICNGRFLTVLDLSQNSFSGVVPKCLIAIVNISFFWRAEHFDVLNLRRNNLTGAIPDTFSGNCGLKTLNLNDNFLQGNIPKSLSNCKMLEVLDVGNNGISDSFPCWLSTIPSLRVLILRSNKFRGSIECLVGNETWPLLQIVDLASNKFNGKLPETFFKTWTAMMAKKDRAQGILGYRVSYYSASYYHDVVTINSKGLEIELVKILRIFTSIDFSCNNFKGKIPEVIGDFRALYVLNLSRNSLTGPIPSSLGNLQQLESLDLSSNNLSGKIPQRLGDLNFLEVLNLSHNQLEGIIPKGNQLQTFSEESFNNNKGLCGMPLMDCGAKTQPPSAVPTSEGNNSDDGTKIDWNLISAEMGFVFGLAVVILPLMFWKRWRIWYYKHVDSVLFKLLPQLDQRNRKHGRRALRTHKGEIVRKNALHPAARIR